MVDGERWNKRKSAKAAIPPSDDCLSHEKFNKAIIKAINKKPKILRYTLGLLYALSLFLLATASYIVVQSVSSGTNQCGAEGLFSGCVAKVILKGTAMASNDPNTATPEVKVFVLKQDQIAPPKVPTSPANETLANGQWAKAVQLGPRALNLAPEHALPVVTSAEKTSILQSYIVRNDANLLATPEPFGMVIGTVRVGDAVTLAQDSNRNSEWLNVTTADGQKGYLSQQDLMRQ